MIGWIFWICVAVIVYVYVGYPALLILLAKTRPRPSFLTLPQPATSEEPSVTILIAAYNEEVCIARKLENTLALHYPPEKLQILVADDGSEDRTPEIVRSFASRGVELHRQPQRQGKNAALNSAMSRVRGEFILLSDANNFYEPDILHALVSPFSDPSIGAVNGAHHILKEDSGLSESEGLYWKYEAFIKVQETRLGSCTAVTGDVLAVRRELYEPIPPAIINEDFYRCMQILRRGYRVVFSPRAQSFERVALTAQDEVARRIRINAGRYQVLSEAPQILPHQPVLIWQVISHKFLRLFIPFAMIGALLANLAVLLPHAAGKSPLLTLSQPVNWAFMTLQVVFYLLAWVGSHRKFKGKIGKLVYLPTFLVNSNLAALQGFLRFITKSQTTLWKRARRAEEGGESNA